ncbi:hypothetical protein F2P81_004615 [Scophthalmus maximus]|uniref:Uncharacterized protein n=1 Tax=Scophthalmus maximus TaxID=52904 RepID=A0A6A4TFS1_SCOMX|nr:hypothetical protein F2P81_004615 [Scophthalmus maximus]
MGLIVGPNMVRQMHTCTETSERLCLTKQGRMTGGDVQVNVTKKKKRRRASQSSEDVVGLEKVDQRRLHFVLAWVCLCDTERNLAAQGY